MLMNSPPLAHNTHVVTGYSKIRGLFTKLTKGIQELDFFQCFEGTANYGWKFSQAEMFILSFSLSAALQVYSAGLILLLLKPVKTTS